MIGPASAARFPACRNGSHRRGEMIGSTFPEHCTRLGRSSARDVPRQRRVRGPIVRWAQYRLRPLRRPGLRRRPLLESGPRQDPHAAHGPLGAQGMTFTDAHGGSSVCTPTRYGILTGRYCGAAGCKIRPGRRQSAADRRRSPDGRLALEAARLRHGLHRQMAPGNCSSPQEDTIPSRSLTAPRTHGFDYFFGISASLDMPPFAFIENDRFTEAPTVKKTGSAAARPPRISRPSTCCPRLTRKAVEYIASHAAAAKAGTPFFLYLALTSPHTPILPTKQFAGQERAGQVRRFRDGDRLGPGPGARSARQGRPGRRYARGLHQRQRLLAGGRHSGPGAAGALSQRRLPRLQGRYLGRRAPHPLHRPLARQGEGRVAERAVDLPDRPAGHLRRNAWRDKLPDNAGEDSVSILPALLGTDQRSAARGGGPPFDQRHVRHPAGATGSWNCAPARAGGAAPGDQQARKKGLPAIQLYDMARDVGEQTNQQAKQPEVVRAARAAAGELRGPRPQHARHAAEERRAGGYLEGRNRRCEMSGAKC